MVLGVCLKISGEEQRERNKTDYDLIAFEAQQGVRGHLLNSSPQFSVCSKLSVILTKSYLESRGRDEPRGRAP